jgi:hypothetical protein
MAINVIGGKRLPIERGRTTKKSAGCRSDRCRQMCPLLVNQIERLIFSSALNWTVLRV